MTQYYSVDDSEDPDRHVRYLDAAAESMASTKARIVDLLDVQPGARVLDLGCGAGHDLAAIESRGGAAFGIDVSAVMCATSASRLIEAGVPSRVVRGDINWLPYPSASFASARLERVLQHVVDPAPIVAEVLRVLRPGGAFVAWEPDWPSLAIESSFPESTDAFVSGVSARARQPRIGRSLTRLLIEAGFVAVESWLVSTHTRSLDELGAIISIDNSLARAVDAGRMTTEAADTWIAEQRELSTTGRFFAALTKVRVRGFVPGSP